MPALFAYLLAVSMLLGGGYAGLRWLSAPAEVSSSHRPSAVEKRSARKLPHKPDRNVAVASEVESESRDSGNAVTPARTATSESSDKAAPEVLRNQTSISGANTQVPAEKDDDVAPGSCMPIGVTAPGDLVFPMQCQQFLQRHHGPIASGSPANSTEAPARPKEGQAGGPAGPVGGENIGSDRKESAKAQYLSPSGETKPATESAERKTLNEKRTGGRNMQIARSKTVRTVDPDGGREERLLPTDHSRMTASRREEQWFSPLVFR